MSEEEGGKKKGKKQKSTSIDILTIIGLVLGIGLMVFGILFTLPPKEPQRESFFGEGEEVEKEFQDAHDKWLVKTEQWKWSGGYAQFGNLSSFIDIPSLAITVGGTFAALMVAYPISIFGKMGVYMKIAIMPNKYDPAEYIEQIVDFAKEARIKGLLSLEDKLASTEDAFLKSSLMLVVDSVEPEKVHELLQAELDKLDERHSVGRTFMDSGGAFAPGFGMIGTLIGLINMLKDMSDPTTIGPAMATALLTTLYGSFLANLVFSPIGNKLSVRHNEEYLCRELITVGVEAIQAGENPKFIEEKLNMLIVQKTKKDKKKKGKGEAESEDAEG